MLIPAVIKAEAHPSADDNDEPTLPASETSKLWSGAALSLSRKLVECARIKQRCLDVIDMKGAREAYKMAKELLELSRVLDGLPALHPETAAVVRRQSVDRVVKLYEESARVLPLAV